MRTMTIEDVKAEQDEYRSRPFVSEETERVNAEWERYLPTEFPSGRENKHACKDGSPCRCSFEFPRGAIFACWSGQHIEDSRKEVVRILGEIENDSGGGNWVVARVLASDAPAYCGQMVFFAPTSIKACCMELVDKVLTEAA